MAAHASYDTRGCRSRIHVAGGIGNKSEESGYRLCDGHP
jgi:hypothetical protein